MILNRQNLVYKCGTSYLIRNLAGNSKKLVFIIYGVLLYPNNLTSLLYTSNDLGHSVFLNDALCNLSKYHWK